MELKIMALRSPSLLNFINPYHLVQKLLGRGPTQREEGDLNMPKFFVLGRKVIS
jgi:hypothetical protein